MKRYHHLFYGPILLALVLAACGKTPSQPVAAVTLEPSSLTLPHGGVAQGELRWQLLDGFPDEADDLLVFVHLVNDRGDVVLTADHPLPASSDRQVVDPLTLFHSALAIPLPSGSYRLVVGLYRPRGERLALRGEAVGRMEYAVGSVNIPPGDATSSYQFSDTWTPPTPGGDRQVRALRWLMDPGSITVQGAGYILLEVRLPEHTEGKQLLLDEGIDEPLVEVTACDGFEQTLRGLGRHRLTIPSQGSCDIQLTPSFSWVDLQTFAKSSLVIEQLGRLP
jgi:hypothetical protein